MRFKRVLSSILRDRLGPGLIRHLDLGAIGVGEIGDTTNPKARLSRRLRQKRAAIRVPRSRTRRRCLPTSAALPLLALATLSWCLDEAAITVGGKRESVLFP